MYPTIYVNSKGEATFYILARVKVGPVFSSCSDKLIFSVDLSLCEIKELLKTYDYQQHQLEFL